MSNGEKMANELESMHTQWVEDRTRCEDCRHESVRSQTLRFGGVRWQVMVEDNLPTHRWMFKVAIPRRDEEQDIDLVFVPYKMRWCNWHGHAAMESGVLWRCDHFQAKIDNDDNDQEGDQWWSESSDAESSTQSKANWWE